MFLNIVRAAFLVISVCFFFCSMGATDDKKSIIFAVSGAGVAALLLATTVIP